MAALTRFAAAALLAFAVPAVAETTADWRPLIAEASRRFGMPLPWIERVMRAESGGRTLLGGRPIVSRAGAIGLMQLMPRTWNALRARLGLGRDPSDPRDNILAGTFYLKLMYRRFGYPGLFAAYNAGPARYAASLSGQRALPAETRAYLAAVTAPDQAEPGATRARATQTLFVALRDRSDVGGVDGADALFAIR